MIQVHGKTILSMEFKSIIKAHDSNWRQFIHPKPNSHWKYQSPTPISNIKTQFLLVTSKPNSYWQHQSSIFISTTLSKRKEHKIIKRLAKEKNIYVTVAKKGPWQSSYEETHWELSWGLCSCIMNPWNTWKIGRASCRERVW